jgi:hypothetical protein
LALSEVYSVEFVAMATGMMLFSELSPQPSAKNLKIASSGTAVLHIA